MKKLETKHKLYLAAAAAFLILAAVLRSAFGGLSAKMRSLDESIRVEEALCRRHASIDARKEGIGGLYASNRMAASGGSLPDRERYVRFLKEIERICKESRIAVVSLNPQNEADTRGPVKKFLADLRADAYPDQAFLFLRGLENSDFPIRAERLAISPKDEDGKSVKFEATLSLSVV